jgi:hypothetical protein
MGIDEKFIDLFTNVDNLIAKLTESQNSTNQLLYQQNLLLQSILAKPTILQAPQLSEITVQQQEGGVSVPENLDIGPQLYYDVEEDKAYVKYASLFTGNLQELTAGEVVDNGNVKVKTAFAAFETRWSMRVAGFDLIRLQHIKNVGFNLETGGLPGTASYEIYKNDKKIWLQAFLPDTSDTVPFDRSDNSFSLKPEDEFRIVVTNSTPNTIRIYNEILYLVFRRLEKDSLRDYLNKIRQLF